MRDACRAVTRCKKANRELAEAKAQGKRLGEPYAEVGFRSRKHPKQGCYIPRRAATKRGAYFTILGNLRMAEQLPDGHQDCRLTRHNGQYHLNQSQGEMRISGRLTMTERTPRRPQLGGHR